MPENNALERITPAINQPTADRKKTVSLSNIVESLKNGEIKNIEAIFPHGIKIEDDDRNSFIEQISKREGVSKAFAERFLDDESFRKRIVNICNNFAINGEHLASLEEAEIYTKVMDPNKKDDISPLLDSTDPSKRFKGSETITQHELITERLLEMRNSIAAIDDEVMVEKVFAMIQNALSTIKLGAISDNDTWEKLAKSRDLLNEFQKNADMRLLYEQATEGQKLNQIGRRIQLYRHEDKNGNTLPAIRVDQRAKNKETGTESRLGFTIEQEGETRILKDTIVVIDKNTRNTNEGMKFLMDNLQLVKKFNIHEAEFVANIKIGSYVWTRISDMDLTLMSENLSAKTLAELGPNPDPKRLKGKIFEELILPTYEQNLNVAAGMAMSEQSPEESQELKTYLMEDVLGTALTELRAKALAGEATMEDFARLGIERDLIHFNKEGGLVENSSPETATIGHLGQAAIMGIPWKARIKMDRPNLFRLIDKLDKGKDIKSLLVRTGQKIGVIVDTLSI